MNARGRILQVEAESPGVNPKRRSDQRVLRTHFYQAVLDWLNQPKWNQRHCKLSLAAF